MRGHQTGRGRSARAGRAIAVASAGLIALGLPLAGPSRAAAAGPNPTAIGTTVDDASTKAGWGTSEVAGASAYDTSSIDVEGFGIAPSGTVTYSFFANGTCTVPSTKDEQVTLKSDGSVPNSPTTAALAASAYSYITTYSGDGNYASSTANCEPFTVGMAMPGITTSSSPAAATVGVQISSAGDAATVTGNGDVVPTGSVTFTLYAADCATVILGPSPSEPLSSNGSTPASASASYATSWTPTATGTYYWVATYSGDSNYETMTDGCGDPSEQVKVGSAMPGITTSSSPAAATVGVSITAKDTATLTGGDAPSGTVTFGLYTNSGCTTAVTPAVGGTVTLSGGTASSSGSWTPAAVGTYYWQATYNGDSNNNSVSTCGGTSEQIVVGKASLSISTVASPTSGTVGKAIKTLKDTATLSGAPIAPTGTVAFKFFSNNTCTTAVTGVSGNGTVASSSASYTVAWTPKAAGTYYWVASYAGDANNAAVASTCGEPVVITAQPTISTTANPKSAGIGTTLQDSATLAGTSNLLGTGSITFKLFGPGDGSCASAIHTETVTAVKTNGPFNTTTGFTAKTVGTYQWTAAFSGDANNAAVASKCGATPVTVGPQISEITPIAATCAQFASGFATSMPSYQYTLSGSKIATVTPSSFTYWVKVPSTGTYKITQSTNETSKKLLLSSGSGVYDNATASSCTTVSSGITQSTTSDAVTVKVSSGSGPFYIGLIFSTSKVIGEAAPRPSTTVQYTFSAGLTGATSVIDLKLG